MDTLVTLAPLLGLLGTVTGIMRSFTSLGGAELAVSKVTGGIGEALIATAVGLFAAIPAVVAYNYFLTKINVLRSEMESFSSDLPWSLYAHARS